MTRPLSQLVFLCRRHKHLAVDIGVHVGMGLIAAGVAVLVGHVWMALVFGVVLGVVYFYARLVVEHQTGLIKTMTDVSKRLHTRLGETHREIEILREKLERQTEISKIKSIIGPNHPRKN